MKKRRYKRVLTQNVKRYRNLCEKCLEWFDTSRPDAQFCGPVCRSAANRDKKKENEQARALVRKHVAEGKPIKQKVGTRKPAPTKSQGA